MKKLILIDAHAVIHRAYHALPPLTSPSGEPTNAVYGFTAILLKIIKELKPDYVAAAFDLPGPTFRHIAYERYKAQRPETPSDLSSQFVKVRQVLDAFGIPCFEKEGYEADDVLGAIVKKFENNRSLEIVIVTGDLDALQLVRPRVKVYSMKKGITDTVIYDEKAVKERYGLHPHELIDFKGLKGDPSDNIPGVKGIGEKIATELIKTFGSIEKLYAALAKGTKKISEFTAVKLREGKEDAKFSKMLATINCEVPLKITLEAMRVKESENEAKIRACFESLGFFSLLKRRESVDEKKPAQGALYVSEKSDDKAVLKIERLKDRAAVEKFLKISRGIPVALIVHDDTLQGILKGSNSLFEFSASGLRVEALENFLSSGSFFVYNGKTVIHFLRKFGIELGRIRFDLMIAAYLTGGFARDFSYLGIATRELGRMVSQDSQEEYIHFFDIVERFEEKLNEGKLRQVFEEIELPAIRILADMEERGVKIQNVYLYALSKQLEHSIALLTKRIYKDAGESFNINSPQQLSVILFERLGMRSAGLRKTEKEGRISTGAQELEKLKDVHQIVPKILEYRELVKLKNTYVDTLPGLVDEKTGRLHTTFNQVGTATGRLSSANPNLQNIPILSEYGREVRKAFIAEKGFLLVSFDYSQIELRVAAHIASDPKMIDAFIKGADIHKITASEIYNVPIEKVTSELRRAAKTLNFGVLYGMGSQALAESAGMSREDAKKFIGEYFHDFFGIKKYIEDTKRFAEEKGYVETIFGRRRYIPEINSPNWQLKHEAERMAVNMPIQGSATGDVIKLAMARVDGWIKKERLSNEVRLLLQVHDELLFEVKIDLVKNILPKIKEIMEGVVKLKVPLVVDVKTGPSWGEQKEFAKP